MRRIAYLIPDSRQLTDEEEQAWKHLASLSDFKSRQVTYAMAIAQRGHFASADLVWWHCDGAYPGASELNPLMGSLKAHAERGGGILLSLLASQASADLGLEAVRPNIIVKGQWSETTWAKDYPDIRGFAGFGEHPLFKGFPGGTYTWAPRMGSSFSGCYYEGALPDAGKVIGLEKLYIKINEQRHILMEYNFGASRILSIGLYFYFADPAQRYRLHLESLLSNALTFVSPDKARRPIKNANWDFEKRRVMKAEHTSKAIPKKVPRLPSNSSGLEIHRAVGTENQFFDLSGRRILLMGRERGGIEEIWSHPTRLIRNIRVGFKVGDAPVQWSDQLNPTVTIRPESLTRRYEFAGAQIRETLFASRRTPAAILHFDIICEQPVKIFVTAQTDLRMMWPLSDQVSGSLVHSWDSGLQAHLILDTRGKNAALFGSSVRPSQYLSGQFSEMMVDGDQLVGIDTDAIQITSGITISFETGSWKCSFVCAGSGLNHAEAIRSYSAAMKDIGHLLRQQIRYYKQLLSGHLQLLTPEEEFNQSYGWSVVNTEKLFAETPGLGVSFLAGFGLSSSGWNGGQQISGRPGYAWYFGRDSVWTSLAVLGYGDFEKVRAVLEFLGTHQDPAGKILHELTTSGYAHYDASDSTPLYLILFGRYLRASGDRAFARKELPRIKKALEYCRSTDTDNDHLIENTNVGHGWIESGALFPTHTEHYLASCWAEALTQSAYISKSLGERTLSAACERKAQRVRKILRISFLNKETGFYNFARNRDGSYRTEKTVLPAVGMYFDCSDERLAKQSLDEYASDNFSADWGVRIVGKNDPLFEPKGYHYGSIWPLFTGWTSLAEFHLHRPVQGFNHLLSNALLFNQFSAGCVEEVLHGIRFEPAGVCPHQAWSGTMVLQPVIEGMLGIKVDASARSVEIHPYLPPQWQEMEVRNIRVGDRQLNMTIRRTATETLFLFSIPSGRKKKSHNSLRLSLRPAFPLGTIVNEITVNGIKQHGKAVVCRYHLSPLIQRSFDGHLEIRYRHVLGISVVPQKPHFATGEESKGLRIIREEWRRDSYSIVAEGRAGQEYLIDVFDASQRVRVVNGAVPILRDRSFLTLSLVFPAQPHDGYSRKQVQLSV